MQITSKNMEVGKFYGLSTSNTEPGFDTLLYVLGHQKNGHARSFVYSVNHRPTYPRKSSYIGFGLRGVVLLDRTLHGELWAERGYLTVAEAMDWMLAAADEDSRKGL